MSVLVLVAVALGGVVGFVSLAYRRRWQWTGLPAAGAEGDVGVHRPAKTLWDWLHLLGIPVALAALAFLLNAAQTRRDQQREDRRVVQQRTAAADAERESALSTYLAQMSGLLLDRGLLRSKRGGDVRAVARTATLTAVRRLDGARRGLVVQFLAEARLLFDSPTKRRGAIVAVVSADLAHAALRRAELRAANLEGSHLGEADLRDATLLEANLYAVDLGAADLRGADVAYADLRSATLSHANLLGASLYRADLRGADLRGADLRGADLRGANLSGGDLRGADVTAAKLVGADLRAAKLKGVRGLRVRGP